MVVVIAGGAWLIARNYSHLSDAVSEVGPVAIVLSLILAVLGTAAIGAIWINLLRGLGATVATSRAAEVFFVSQLGKYLPGSVWPIVAQMEYGRRSNTPRRTMLAANLLMLAIVTATGLIVGAAFLPWSSADGLHRYWPVLFALVPLVASLHPRVIPAVLDLLFRIAGREPMELRVDSRRMLSAVAWGLGVWVLLGAHLLIMTRALGATGPQAAAAAIGGMGLAFAAGLIFIPAPAGAGIRDAVLVATFTPQIGATNALAVALASRVLLVVADVVLAAAGAIAARVQRSAQVQRPSQDP